MNRSYSRLAVVVSAFTLSWRNRGRHNLHAIEFSRLHAALKSHLLLDVTNLNR